MKLLRRAAFLLVCGWLLVPPAVAQSCAMCRTGLLGYGPAALEAMNFGIVLLLIPPLAIGAAIVFFAFHRDQSADTEG